MKLEKFKEVLGEKFSRDVNFLNSIVDELKLADDSKILDVGTGWGFMAIAIALHGYYVITGEPKDAKWADWRSKAKLANVEDKITFKPFNAENLPFENAIFDAVFLYTSLHHINDKKRALNEILRVMKQNGYLIIIELTQKAVDEIKKRHLNHPNAINPINFTKEFNLQVKILENRYLKAFIFRNTLN